MIWRDVGLDTCAAANPGPFQYRVEAQDGANPWKTILDRTNSQEDLIIDYREVSPVSANRVRLVITGWPKGIKPGVAEFTVFGNQKFE